ncbi:ATP-binding protein [Halomicroarcula sp. GCM10025894]|uniref:ATP-binding protein n=1 Tax=Halomicroarcula sp. GCM10025894 TaxID=3252673 RepID=UPI0036068002
MHPATTADADATVRVENIGGIDSATVALSPGVTVLAGRNATNRTSFLKAMMAALGSDWTAVKGDAKQGAVSLTLGEQTYERQLTRAEDGIVSSGDGLLADPTLANLFAFLLEDNEARQAVVRGRTSGTSSCGRWTCRSCDVRSTRPSSARPTSTTNSTTSPTSNSVSPSWNSAARPRRRR